MFKISSAQRLQQVKTIQLNLHFSIILNSVCLLSKVPHSAMTSHIDKPSPISLLPKREEKENSKLTCIRQPLENNTWHISVVAFLSAELHKLHKSARTFSSNLLFYNLKLTKKYQDLRGKSFIPTRTKLARIYTCPSSFKLSLQNTQTAFEQYFETWQEIL